MAIFLCCPKTLTCEWTPVFYMSVLLHECLVIQFVIEKSISLMDAYIFYLWRNMIRWVCIFSRWQPNMLHRSILWKQTSGLCCLMVRMKWRVFMDTFQFLQGLCDMMHYVWSWGLWLDLDGSESWHDVRNKIFLCICLLW